MKSKKEIKKVFDIDEAIEQIIKLQMLNNTSHKGTLTLTKSRPKSIKCLVSFKEDEKNEFFL